MKKRDFDIAFRGLALGPHEFQYDLDDTFFTLFEYSDYQGLIGKAELMMLKSETVLDLEWRFTGNIEAPCDVTCQIYQHQSCQYGSGSGLYRVVEVWQINSSLLAPVIFAKCDIWLINGLWLHI